MSRAERSNYFSRPYAGLDGWEPLPFRYVLATCGDIALVLGTMPRTAEAPETLSLRMTDDDQALVVELRRLTGIQSKGDVTRLALRTLYRERTGANWEAKADGAQG